MPQADVPEEQIARVPFSTVLASVAGLWLCYFTLTTLRWELLGLGLSGELLLLRPLACLAGMVVTLALWLVLRLFDARPLWAKITAALLLSIPTAILLVQSNDLVFSSLQERVNAQVGSVSSHATSVGGLWGPDPLSGGDTDTGDASVYVQEASPWQSLIEQVFGRYFMMLAWCALYLALLTGEKARAAERREGAYRRAAKAAELRSLRYQVNPHFLFNTLNSLSALVLTGKTQAAERMIQQLSTFYRRSLADDPTADVPLREEFALQKLYLDIEGVRFPHRLRAVYQLPPELEDARVPGMILQPLVENTVRHAVAPTSGQITVILSAREEYGRLVIEVSDDGPGASAGEGRPKGFGIGLANVRDRLAARFGDEASVVSGPAPGGYASQIRLPMMSHEEDEA
ncbi:MAG TPA: histidine kinase [Croceibacterium sp.]|nr:histidine kinase [Croceibacterium sp.]